MVTGLGKDKIDWTTPLPLTAAAVEYVKKLQSVAPAGPDRLVFFQDYLENADPLLGAGCLRRIWPGAVRGAARA